MVLDLRSGQDNAEAYYNFDISSLKNNSSEIEKVYLATNGKNGGRAGLVYNCNDYDLKLVSKYEDVSNITVSGNRIAYFNSQSPTLSDKVNAVDAALYPELAVYGIYNLMRHDITELVQTSLAEDDTTLTLKFTAGSAALFESQSPLYLYVEYKDDTPLVVDNGSSLKINVRPSKYITPAADTTITVAVASYNDDGTLAGIETNDFDAKDTYTSYTSELDAADYKVFVWDAVGTMKSLNTPVTNITEGE